MYNYPAKFITSAPRLEDCPPESLPEICFAGRSNVGKSSLINGLLSRKKLARTSNVPGKTQQMNYYQIGDSCFFVDLPGYGYAKVPIKERNRWGRNIREYLLNRKTLKLIVHLVDVRHKPTTLDEDFFFWMASNEMPFCVLLSKADKISKNKVSSAKAEVKKILAEMNIKVPILAYSSDNKQGIKEVQDLLIEFVED
ncbi:MAG: ribosome biogenesis GTP-binding protein YihA/YsxC [Balneolaceae bacterium]